MIDTRPVTSSTLITPAWRRRLTSIARRLPVCVSVVAALIPVIFRVSSAAGAAPQLVRLSAGGHVVVAEVAATDESRGMGLMNATDLPTDRGMLFVYPEPRSCCMWMLHTSIPLSVAFIDGDGAIVNTEEMEPNSETLHCSTIPVPYVLEMNRGWFRERGLGPGSLVSGLDRSMTSPL